MVKSDSKKEKTENSIENCLEESYSGNHKLGTEAQDLPFYVSVYPFKGIHQVGSHFREGLNKIKSKVMLLFPFLSDNCLSLNVNYLQILLTVE